MVLSKWRTRPGGSSEGGGIAAAGAVTLADMTTVLRGTKRQGEWQHEALWAV